MNRAKNGASSQDLQALLQDGLKAHQAGRLTDADAAYRRILAVEPDHADANHLLGVIAHQAGDFWTAVELIGKAIRRDPASASYHCNLGNALYRLDRLDEAVASQLEAIALKDDYAKAHNNLANALLALERLDDAVVSYRKALLIVPDDAATHANLGVALHAQGHMDQAEASYRKALALNPKHAEAHTNLGNTLQETGRLEDAVACHRQAIALAPDFAKAHNGLGNAFQELGKLEDALSSHRKALELNPDHVEAHANLGNILASLGRLEEAVSCYHQAIALDPDLSGAYTNLGNALQGQGLFDDAVANHRKALSIQPDSAAANNNLGNALMAMGKLDEAVDSYQKALAIRPDFAEAHSNLGATLKDLGRLEEAVASFQKALAIKPDFDTAMTELLHQLRHACAWPDVDELEPKVREITKQSISRGGKVALRPFDSITSSDDVSENYAVAQSKSGEIAKKVSASKTDFQKSGAPPSKPRITIGYLSSDFQDHATSHLMLSLFGLHDRKDFNVFTFSHGQNNESAYRKKIENDSDKFFNLQTAGHLEAAGQIFESGVDILIDLKGHTQNSRLEICALRPSPVQATYLGFPGTTGADFLDYIITDRIVTPEDQSPYYSEQFVYLPHCYQANDHQQKISDVTFTRSLLGLPEKGFVFCSFNNSYKIEPVIFGVWMNLLKKVPDSVLWLLKGSELAERNLKSEAQARGVDGDRLIFAERMPKDQHLARHRLVDLALDTRICGGHTTTSDCLWAGVPVVTMSGSHFASRVSASLLNAVGLPELITQNLEEYETLAFRLSQNPDELDGLTTKLAHNRLSEPLFDTPRFVANLENAYRRMWDNYLSGEQPVRIDVIEG